MLITIRIPKEIKTDTQISSSVFKKDTKKRFYNDSHEWMEIIENKEFNKLNIQFSGIPNNTILEILKVANWKYSYKKKIWYPHTKDATNTSETFINQLQENHYPNIE